MPRGRPIEPVVLTDDEKNQLLSLANSRSLPHGVVRRAQIVLACAQGEANASIARRMRLSDATVGKWRKRYRMQGIEGLHDELRPGRPRTHDDERVAEVINTALQTKPPDGATHWSVRAMAEQSGVSKSTVQRWFSLFAIQPTASATSSSPTTPSSSRRCAISSASISTRPTTPSCSVSTRKPRSRRSTAPNRCCRWGWATSKGSPTITSVTAPPPCSPPSTSPPDRSSPSARSAIATRSFSPSCATSTPTSPEPFDVHLIADNYATHKHPKVRAWLARRPRYHIHYTPTYASWLNQVERWFGIITQTAIRRGSFSNVSELVNKIDLFVPPLQRQSHTLHVDRNRRLNTRKSPETLLIYLWDTTLASGTEGRRLGSVNVSRSVRRSSNERSGPGRRPRSRFHPGGNVRRGHPVGSSRSVVLPGPILANVRYGRGSPGSDWSWPGSCSSR